MKKLVLAAIALLVAAPVFASDSSMSILGSLSETSVKYMFYFLAMAIAVYGGTAAQSKAASVALEGIARNPSAADKLQTPMILGLALMESLVIFTLISVFLV